MGTLWVPIPPGFGKEETTCSPEMLVLSPIKKWDFFSGHGFSFLDIKVGGISSQDYMMYTLWDLMDISQMLHVWNI